jgi:hypothetical protein
MLFARSGEPVAQRAASALLEALSRLDPGLLAVQDRDGIGVAEYDVTCRSCTTPTSAPAPRGTAPRP